MRICFGPDGSFCDQADSYMKYPGDEKFKQDCATRLGKSPVEFTVREVDGPFPWETLLVAGIVVQDFEKTEEREAIDAQEASQAVVLTLIANKPRASLTIEDLATFLGLGI